MYQLGARVIVVDGRVRDLESFGEREDLMVRCPDSERGLG